MDPEQTFLRVHARLSGMLSQLLTPRIRLALEYIYLTVAVALFCLLVVMHTNFVQQPGCSSELAGIEFTEVQLVQIKINSDGLWAPTADGHNWLRLQTQKMHTESSTIPDVNGNEFTILKTDFLSNWLRSGARNSKLIFKSWKSGQEIIEPHLDNVVDSSIAEIFPKETDIKDGKEELNTEQPIPARGSFKLAVFTFSSRNPFGISKIFHMFHVEHIKSFLVEWLEKRSRAFEPTYLYTVEKGYFLLPEGAKSRHNIQTVNVTISAQSSCFGNRWQQILINSFVGYDTILMNSLSSSPGQGYLYNFQTKEFYDLSHGHEPSEGPTKFGDYFVTKCGVLIMSLFVFFTTTMSVSFTLRETQSRMLKFTVQLQHHARHQLPTFQLIFVHVIESLVFVPIMIGILFFLFEFYDDQLLAFLVLTLVWLCELFTMISVRTSISMQFFPRFFLLYFLVFHIYFFSYAHGFSYLAFSATAAFMQHLILYFWNRFEVPALQRFMRSRGQMQQHADVQITSSTIYTSTLHIARVNVRNAGGANNDPGIGHEDAGPNRPGPENLDPDARSQEQPTMEARSPNTVSGTLRIPDFNTQQRGGAGLGSTLNPLGSLLLWILGGASPDAIVSFFSMFRDVRDPAQGQNYAEPPQHEDEPRAQG